jgi:hypothetical protein
MEGIVASKSALIGISVTGAVAVTGAYTYNHIQQQRSLREGISPTEPTLAKVEELLDENQTEILKLISSVQIDLGANLEHLFFGRIGICHRRPDGV